jgi:hypothetical protein
MSKKLVFYAVYFFSDQFFNFNFNFFEKKYQGKYTNLSTVNRGVFEQFPTLSLFLTIRMKKEGL